MVNCDDNPVRRTSAIHRVITCLVRYQGALQYPCCHGQALDPELESNTLSCSLQALPRFMWRAGPPEVIDVPDVQQAGGISGIEALVVQGAALMGFVACWVWRFQCRSRTSGFDLGFCKTLQSI